MRKLLLMLIFLSLTVFPVNATEVTAPSAPLDAQKYLPEETDSFWDGLLYVIKSATGELQPSIAEAAQSCLSIIAVTVLTSLLNGLSGGTKKLIDLAGCLAAGILLLQPTNSLIQLGTKTIQDLSEYGKMLIPVMTAALAAQGAVSTSSGLYVGTVFFNSILSTVAAKVLVPLLYMFLCLCLANSAIGEQTLQNLRKFIKWAITWCMKVILYIFTGYIGITGVISGSADAAAIKATKLSISSAVPVIGGILSDASETILVSVDVMKSAAGVYGALSLIAVMISPFLRIGVHYLLLKGTAAICSVFGSKESVSILKDFSTAMGFVLAMVGSLCLMLLISIVCFMKGVT